MSNVYNATGSINYWFTNNLKPVFDSVYGSNVCFYYDTDVVRKYPSCSVFTFSEAGHSNKTYELKNLIEFHISINKDLKYKRTQLMEAFIDTIGLDIKNVSDFVQIPLLDYATNENSPQQIGCMRLAFLSNGWRNTIDNIDPTIRHTSRDLILYYR